MKINGTDYNESSVASLTLDEFKTLHKDLPYFKNLVPKLREKELEKTYNKLVGEKPTKSKKG